MAAYAELFEPLRGRIYSVAVRLAGQDAAEDIVMDTFLKAWQGLPEYNGRAALGTWLCRIAHNCALDHLRRAKVRKAQSLDDPDGSLSMAQVRDPRGATPSEEMQRAEESASVQAAIARLPDAHRQVILLRYVDDLRYAEIAAALGISIGTVMSRLFHARAKLRGLLRVKETYRAGGEAT